MDIKTQIQGLKSNIEKEISDAKKALESIDNTGDLEDIKTRFLGKKSYASSLLKKIGSLEKELKPVYGKEANILKNRLGELIGQKEQSLKSFEFEEKLRAEKIDLTLPSSAREVGGKNIITQMIEEIEDYFVGRGFIVAQGPEIETDYYNFEALNTPADHPARSLHDTFFIEESILLRTHTSPVQIRYMEENKPPIYIIAPGKVYRKDYDVSHTPMFTQIEGLVVDEGINFCNLKWMLEDFAHAIFGKERKVRFRPHYFPFTEPSAEVDVSCNICDGKGCRVCSGSGWLEILGAGMVDPNLYDYVKYDKESVSGFAFGVGIERICMLRYGIDDLRMFFENDIRFLRQF